MPPVKMSENQQTYWRGVEDLEDSPEFQRWVQDEFPEGLRENAGTELLSPVNRRSFMTLMGASMALAGLTGCFRRPEEYILPYSKAPEDVLPGVPNFYASTFVLGGYALGAVAESHEGRPTKLEGNPEHPSSLGASTAYMQASLLDLYDPDRATEYKSGGQVVDRKTFVEAVRAKASELKAKQGAGLRFLSEALVSPTLLGLKKRVLETYPQAVWHSYEPVSDENVYAGGALAFGESSRPSYMLNQAQVIVAVDSDFLGNETDSVALSRQWAQGRRIDDPAQATSNRLYSVEGRFTLTGTMADHRLRIRPSQIDSFLRTLAGKLAAAGVEMPAEVKDAVTSAAGVSFGANGDKVLDVLVKELQGNLGASAILVGRGQPAHVHALANALNVALGNQGKTVNFVKAAEEVTTDATSLAALTTAMKGGQVDTLVILGGNPAFNAPADLGFAEALKGVATSIRLGQQADETRELCTMVAPRSHFLESWGDARGLEGTASLVQPLVETLYNSLSDIELVSQFVEVPSNRGYDLVRAHWQGELASADFERLWRKMLHDGVVAGSAFAPLSTGLNAAAVGEALKAKPVTVVEASATNLEVIFAPCPKLYDGRYANNGWMQETPDPMTKLTWDNAAVMSFATAKALGLRNQNLVKISYKDRSVTLPVWILPGQADFTVVLNLGYGRTAAGHIGNGVGVNVYLLRDSAAPNFDGGATVAKVGELYRLASTQLHGRLEWYPEGEEAAPKAVVAHDGGEKGEGEHAADHSQMRPIVQEASIATYQKNPKFAVANMEHVPELKSIFTEHEYTGQQWGMTVDMNTCTGCTACVVACTAENNIPVVGKTRVLNGREMHWIRLDRYFTGSEESESLQAIQQPMLCQHCENAPCEPVCPVAATVHSKEGGTNDMAYNRCIGTRYCSNNCPYKVRRFNYFNYHEDFAEVQKMVHNPEVTVRMRGVMEKCTYCLQRINRARRDMKLSNQTMIPDGAITPACAQACPVQAITFGDINDPNSRVAQMKKLDRNYAVLAELNVKPRTSYLARIRNPNPELA